MRGRTTFITQPQIHHHHHNLHHHTHTHNVVENHHHYPITTVTVPPQGYSFNSLSKEPPNFSSVVQNDENRSFLQEPVKKCADQKVDSRQHPAPAAVSPSNKLPLSYRDVAARSDPITGSDGGPLPQAKKLQSTDNENRSSFVKPREAVSTEGSKGGRTRGDRKARSEQPVEFQKITRKKVVTKKEKTDLTDTTSHPYVGESSAVEAPTKYEVLQKLTSKTTKGAAGTENVLVSKRERGNGAGTVIDVVARPKRAIDVDKKKQASGNSNSGNQASQRRRPARKRNEHGWLDKAVVIISLLFGWFELGFRWILNLVVDVCLQIYDVTSFSSFASSLRQIDVRRMLRFREPEPLMWGLEENIILPTTGEEALERFLCSPKCHDAYGVLGLRASCTEEDVRRHYKKLSALLNPDKNPLEGAEEAYEMVTKAYQVLSTPESRKAYNFNRIRPGKNDLHHELGEMWDRIRERIEEARSSMYCDCGRRHARIALDIRQNEARYCRRCRTRHPARANDIWVETRLYGLLWVYFTCCDGIVYDITDWATCEVNYLKHVRPNSHTVQYRLVSPPTPSSGRLSSGDSTSHHQHNDKLRDFTDVTEDFRPDWARPGHAQVSYLPLEPRDEDRSRRAANRHPYDVMDGDNPALRALSRR
ncbi:DnaJ domain protein [Ancylostoma duodenale]|uniref:DnaJ domain protein n=1 Tax=Ancylostoma duodenale TaxID=51022 RepID=A0A0C2GHG2_9BILA|nr:DnaJ domain protein [Ancylostoma duodenale]